MLQSDIVAQSDALHRIGYDAFPPLPVIIRDGDGRRFSIRSLSFADGYISEESPALTINLGTQGDLELLSLL